MFSLYFFSEAIPFQVSFPTEEADSSKIIGCMALLCIGILLLIFVIADIPIFVKHVTNAVEVAYTHKCGELRDQYVHSML